MGSFNFKNFILSSNANFEVNIIEIFNLLRIKAGILSRVPLFAHILTLSYDRLTQRNLLHV